jgi:hypothetical protein
MDNIVPLQLRVPPSAGTVTEEDAATDPAAQAEVKNVLTAFAVATAKGTPQSIIVLMVDAEGKNVVMTGGAFDITETIGIMEDIKFNMLCALNDARE